MRALPAAVLVSTALHTGAIAWVRTHHAKPPPKHVVLHPVRAASGPGAPAAADPAPITVVLLPDDSVKIAPAPPPAAAPRSPASPAAHHRVAAISTGRPIRNETPPSPAAPPPETPATPHPSLFDMRRPSVPPPAVALSQDALDHFLAHSRPLAPPDTASERIAGQIADARARLGDPDWVARATPDQVRQAREDLARGETARAGDELHPAAGGHHTIRHSTFSGDVAPDGTVHFKDARNLGVDGVGAQPGTGTVGLGGHFDVTDWAMRSHGMDPYAAAKLRALDATRAERVAIGKHYREEQLARSPAWMQRNLTRLWASTRDPAERKELLFELWDECAETGDRELVAGGAAARRYLVGFIRTELPAGSPGAYTPEELARFNAHRRSKAAFSPYD